MWGQTNEVGFRVHSVEREVMVLNNGYAEIDAR